MKVLIVTLKTWTLDNYWAIELTRYKQICLSWSRFTQFNLKECSSTWYHWFTRVFVINSEKLIMQFFWTISLHKLRFKNTLFFFFAEDCLWQYDFRRICRIYVTYISDAYYWSDCTKFVSFMLFQKFHSIFDSWQWLVLKVPLSNSEIPTTKILATKF